MLLTNRAILLFLLAGLLMFLFSTVIPPLWGFAFFNGFWLFFVIWDYFLTPCARFFSIERDIPGKLSVDADNRITLSVENRSVREVWLLLSDDSPFDEPGKPLKVKVSPGQTAITPYTVKPYKRGDFQFGYVWVRVQGVLGLIIRQFRLDLGKNAEVYPNIAQVRNYDLFSIRGRLREMGMRPSKAYGVGLEFESLREYRPDDDFRRINWKASARKGRIIAENFDVERSQSLMMVIDAGRMMMTDVAQMTKIDYAINAALLLSYVAMKGDDRVGLLTFSKEVKRFIPAAKGKKQLHLIINALQKTEASMEEPDFSAMVKYLSMKNRKRSLVVIFTDLVDSEISQEMLSYLRGLYPEHLPLCVLINDPAITQAASAAPEDSSTLFRRAVAEDLLWQRDLAIGQLRRHGVVVLDASPETLSSVLVNKYLELKLKGRL